MRSLMGYALVVLGVCSVSISCVNMDAIEQVSRPAYQCPGVTTKQHRSIVRYTTSAGTSSRLNVDVDRRYQMIWIEKDVACSLHVFLQRMTANVAKILTNILPLTPITDPGEQLAGNLTSRPVSAVTVDRVTVDFTSGLTTVEASVSGMMLATSSDFHAVKQSGLGLLLPAFRVKFCMSLRLVHLNANVANYLQVDSIAASVSFVDVPVLIGGFRSLSSASAVHSAFFRIQDALIGDLFEAHQVESGSRSLEAVLRALRDIVNAQLSVIPVDIFQPNILYPMFQVTKVAEQRAARIKEQDKAYNFK